MHAGWRGLMRGYMRGFSLIEVLVVVAILAIAATIVVPMMNQDSVRVPATARMVAADLSYAQNVATTMQQKVYVLFQTSGSRISGYQVALTETPAATSDFVTRPGNGSAMAASFGSAANQQPWSSCQLALVQAGTTNISEIVFDALGQPCTSASGVTAPFASAGTVRITNSSGSYVTDLTIQPITGVVNVPK